MAVSKFVVTVVCLLSAPWLILGPLNIFKVSIINKPSPMAKHFVSKDSEICQAGLVCSWLMPLRR
jgi:hypothetical protein